MEPQEITVERLVEKLDEILGMTHDDPLSCSMREHLSIEGQSAISSMRERLPLYHQTVRTVEE